MLFQLSVISKFAQFILTLIVVAFTILVYAITGGAFLAYLLD